MTTANSDDKKNNSFLEYFDKLSSAKLAQLLAAQPQRIVSENLRVGELQFDFCRNFLDENLKSMLPDFLDRCGFFQWRSKLFGGEIVNLSEQRAALHTALRGPFPPSAAADQSVPARVITDRQAVRQFAEQIRSGQRCSPSGRAWGHILHLGVGGSSLGPELLIDALTDKRQSTAAIPACQIVSGADSRALTTALKNCDPEVTLVILASKSFTTAETVLCAKTVKNWLRSAHVTNPDKHFVAITSATDRARHAGIEQQQIFSFPEGIGGRYSVWSAVSLVCNIALGSDQFDQFLAGAATMDRHFLHTPPAINAPVLAAVLDVCYGHLGCETQAVFPYDGRLRKLVPYLQQLIMESNGKSCRQDGSPTALRTSPIIWGGVGTEVQHSVFQLLHQGNQLVPIEFVCVRTPCDSTLPEHHKQQMINCISQATALMHGSEILNEQNTEAAHRCPGNRPSTTVVMEQLSPDALGALLSYWEARCFTAAVIWEINPFDQMGVELGKKLVKSLEQSSANSNDPICPVAAMRMRQWLGNKSLQQITVAQAATEF